jgi:tRNA (cmo5U34)-methyltransferase
VGDGIVATPGSWSFGGDAAQNFDAHVARSVPFYAATHGLVAELSDRYLAPGGRAYDLGCSTGALTSRLAARHADRVELVGVDLEPSMTAQARARCAQLANVTIIDADVVWFELRPADFVVAHYTLQFVPPADRGPVVDRIAGALRHGGAFLLFEKVADTDLRADALMTALYHDWKRAQGYTDEEIAAKASSLEGVLQPFTHDANRELLAHAGFGSVTTVYRWLNWEGLLATVG